jgi:hypothetical protein
MAVTAKLARGVARKPGGASRRPAQVNQQMLSPTVEKHKIKRSRMKYMNHANI